MSSSQREVLLVDDEPLARQGLRKLLEACPDFRVAAECKNGLEAVRALRDEHFDLVLLDIELPELDGFEVLSRVPVSKRPPVVFITAFDQYAVQAFEAHALDYLVKPVAPARFAAALDRVRIANHSAENERRLNALLDEIGPTSRHPTRVAAKAGGRTCLIAVDEIDWIQAADNYVRLHTGGRTVLQRESISHLVERLNPAQFVRIHRSHAVNISRIRELRAVGRGDGRLLLEGGTELTVSRSYRSNLERVFKD